MLAVMVVERAVAEPKVIVPGPDAIFHEYVMGLASVAVAVWVKMALAVTSGPALTTGGVVSGTKARVN